jgi:hypothetical protein
VGSEVVVTEILDSLEEAEAAPGRDVLEVEEVEVDSGIVDSGTVEEGKDEEVSSAVDVLEAEDVSSTVEVVDEVVAGGRADEELDVVGSSEVDSAVVVSGTSEVVVVVGSSVQVRVLSPICSDRRTFDEPVVVLVTGGVVGSVFPSEEPVGVSA